MSDPRAPSDRTEVDDEAEAPIDTAHESVPDESSLMGKVGIEEEILAELARAEAKMSDPTAPDDPNAAGAQV
jgi:hypothetical protein